MVQPVIEVRDWTPSGSTEGNSNLAALAVLVGLGKAQMDHQSLADVFDVGYVQPNKFGAAECTCKADQQERLVSDILGPVTHPFKNGKHVLAEQGLGLSLRSAKGPANSPQRSLDQTTADRVVPTRQLMCLGERSQPALQGSNLVRLGMAGDLACYLFRSGWKGSSPTCKMAHIRLIGAL